MYLIYLLIVFILSSYIYQRYLPYLIFFDEYDFLLLVCLFYSLLYVVFK